MPVQVGCDSIEVVPGFTYTSSNSTMDGKVHNEVKICITKAARTFGCLQRSIFKIQAVYRDQKKSIQGCSVVSTVVRSRDMDH